ncbi:hypothetical protein KY284_010638 [Solanum tuberosum]|nr:hypothetical protein KY284_010638 [Solanum tuberosum]
MSRTRASVSNGRGEADLQAVVKTPARSRCSARARGHTREVVLVRGHAHGGALARGRAREASPDPLLDVTMDKVPPEFGAPLF